MGKLISKQEKVVLTKSLKRKDNRAFALLSTPALIQLIVFAYLPMFGIIIAFKDYRYDKGILGSEWYGFENFKFFFTSQDFFNVTRNTIFLNLLFIITGLIFSVGLALLLYEVKKRFILKFLQTTYILPSFLSWVVVGYLAYALLNPELGVLNRGMKLFGLEPISWYANPEYWPAILTAVNIWRIGGLNSVIYLAGLIGIDPSYYEAAKIDGASRWQCVRYVSLPMLKPLMIIMTILAIGNIFRADFGMFYNVTRNSPMLYSTTDVIDTYVYRALRDHGDVGMSAAVGLYQSVVGFFMILITNNFVKKIEPENALF